MAKSEYFTTLPNIKCDVNKILNLLNQSFVIHYRKNPEPTEINSKITVFFTMIKISISIMI